MKRVGHLYEKVVTLDNIVNAMVDYDSRRPCHLRKGVNVELAREMLSKMETDFKGLIGTPRKKVIREYGKERELQIPSYQSCVAQIALWRVCEPYVDKRLHNQTFSSRKGYGGHLLAGKCARFIHLNAHKPSKDGKVSSKASVADNAKYALYFDIRKFYQHIDHDIVMRRLATVFKDKRVLSMFRDVIDSSEVGLPIGYPFSHALANLYLVPLYFHLKAIKFVSKIYVYMDNWTVFSRYKKPLHKAVAAAKKWLASVGCEMKGDWQIFPTASRGVRVCGFVVGRGQTRLYRGNWLRTRRDFRKAERGDEKANLSMASRRGWLRFINREFSETFRTKKGTYLWQ